MTMPITIPNMHVTCASCGKDFVRKHGEVNRKYCSRDCYIAKQFPLLSSLDALRICKQCKQEKPLMDFEEHRGHKSERGHVRRHTCKVCLRKKYSKSHTEADRRWQKKLKREVFIGLGGKCTCCGESELDFLTLHHIGGWGHEHKKAYGRKNGQSIKIFTDVKRLGFPRDLFGVLCWNCHMTEEFRGGCPHKRKVEQ